VTSDYSVDDVPSVVEAEKAFNAATRFFDEVKGYLQKWLSEIPH
jgi:hypothetical protein